MNADCIFFGYIRTYLLMHCVQCHRNAINRSTDLHYVFANKLKHASTSRRKTPGEPHICPCRSPVFDPSPLQPFLQTS